jgi:subtilisin family serine protease
MDFTRGRPEIVIGLIDGPVEADHPDLAEAKIQVVPGKLAGVCVQASNSACLHGTFVAGILSARRSSAAAAICPDCTLLVRSIFAETNQVDGQMPSASPGELAEAIIETVQAGARVINLSVALAQSASRGQRELEEALDYSASRGVIILAAAGNQGGLGSSVITRHAWVIPIAAYDLEGRPMVESNLGSSIGRRGLGAPGEAITSLGAGGKPLTFRGTSAATPFVTGAAALIWSEFPAASAAEVKYALLQGSPARRATVVPPLLDAWAAYQWLRNAQRRN